MKVFCSFLLLLFATAVFAQTDTTKSRYANIDDVKIHYKIYGTGDPLILLHGSLENIDEWFKQIPDFSKKYKVIAIDNRGHGKSTFTDRKLDYQLMGEDVIGLMKELSIDSAHIVGFGDGGIIGLTLAINHPDKVRKLVAIGANYKVDTTAVYSEVLKKVEEWNSDKIYQYVRNHFKGYPNYGLIDAFTQRMKTLLLTEPNLTLADLNKIKCPTLFITGDHDIIKLPHTTEMFESVKQGYLAVIPGTKHYPHKERPLVVNPIILDFLSKKFVKLNAY